MKYSRPTVAVTKTETISPRSTVCDNGYTCGTENDRFTCGKFTCKKSVVCTNFN